MRSSQKKPASAAAPAPLNELWPDQYSGVPPMVPGARGVQFGSGAVSGLPSVSASRMAVAGRQCRYLNFVVMVGATVSESDMLSSASRRAASGRDSARESATASAIWIQAAGG